MFVDRSSTWARTGFIATIWAAILVGLLGGYSHWVYDMNDVDGVR